VNGLIGDFPGALVVHATEDIDRLPHDRKLGIVSQTTQPIDAVLGLVAAIRAARPQTDVRFIDTVCQPTKNRQLALRKLIEECDTLVVVGGLNSNNTLQLVAAGKTAGLLVFHIERPDELRSDWLRNSQVVGLTAGTSTLKETVAEVHAQLICLAENSANRDPGRTEDLPLPHGDANAA
jgi:4-hydroxy-3-methylbut-2-enyl diphosphate reductase